MLTVCGILSLFLGMIWYNQKTFGKSYMKALGADTNISPEKMKEIQKKMWQLFLTQFILAAFQAWVLSMFILQNSQISPLNTSIWIWAGFVMPTLAGSAIWGTRPRKDAWSIFLITSGYQLTMFIIFTLIIKIWI